MDHAKGGPRKSAMELYWKNSSISEEEKAEELRDNQQQSIVPGIASMQAADLQKTKKKFDIAYLIAKEELPMRKYAAIIDLEKKHGVDLGTIYCNEMQAATFITNIGEEFGSQLKQKLMSNVNFLSILTDASIDGSNIEKEAVFVRYFESKPVDSNEVKVCHHFVSLPDLESGKAGGVFTAIEDSFKEIETYYQLTEKIVAFGADGASVNQGKHGGAIAELRKNFGDWIIYIWCVSHRLELTLKDALKGTPFDDIDEMYYLYEHSPKKIRELQEIYDKYKDILEFDEGGLKPLRASGTRWIAYKVDAMKLVLDKYGLFINHLKQMSVDRSYTSTDRAKFIGWLRK